MKNLLSFRRIWWLDVIVPLLLSALFFAGLFYLVYSGQKHRRISSMLEERLIDFSLRIAGPADTNIKDNIQVISLAEIDTKQFDVRMINGYRDAAINDYANILKTLIEKKPKAIFINWVPSAHDKNESYENLIKVLKNKHNTEIFLSVRNEHKQLLPPELLENVFFLFNDACLGRVQVVCSYDRNWDQWIQQNIINRFTLEGVDLEKSSFVQNSLPRMFPGYILYLERPEDFTQINFSQIESDPFTSNSKSLEGKTLFLGNSLFQNYKTKKDYYLEIGRVRTAMSPSTGDIRKVGTPIHLFWAQLARMASNNNFISVPPSSTIWICTGIFVVSILLLLYRFGAATSIGVFLFTAGLAPFINAWLIHTSHYYIPIFDGIFGGISSFLFASFGKLSLSAYKKWWILVQKKQEEESRDLKTNFISLISHNLNTPVAKMQGMLDLVEQYATDPISSSSAHDANAIVTEIQLCIKAILTLNALEEKRMYEDSISTRSFFKELQQNSISILSRLDLNVEVQLLNEDDELNDLPQIIDKKFAHSLILSSCILLRSHPSKNIKILLSYDESETPDGKDLSLLRCEIRGEFTKTLYQAKYWLEEDESDAKDEELKNLVLLENISINLMNAFNKSKFGSLRLSKDAHQATITIDFTTSASNNS
ncbi:MAG: hypothetical protein R3B45_04370 [Bdellovibrionota bacterium]